MSKIIGIDLGTCMSCVSVMEGGNPTVINNSEGKRTTPSIVGFKDGERKVGDPAKRQAITNPKNTVFAIKRFIGCKYDDVVDEANRVPYTVKKSAKGLPVVDIEGKEYSPQEISAMVLQKMKQTAEDYLGEEVKEAVITVPAYFSDSQRQATKEAGEIAGLDVKRIINEPTAAALAYGLDKTDKDEKIAVFDFGGGTFDISILELGDGVFEVMSTNGDTHLGGEDIDSTLVNWMADEFASDNSGVDIRKDNMALQRLKEAAEKAKIELSSNTSTEINLPYLSVIDGTPIHFVKTLNRAKFEDLCKDIFNRTLEPCKQAIADAKINVSDIDEVILVGGSTRIPKVQELVKQFFGKEPNKGVNPDEVVSTGAAIQGGVLAGDVKDVVLLDVTPLNLGIESMGGVMTTLIDANTTIPTTKSEIFTTATDNQPAVSIRVLQGNRPMANDNKQIGIFNLEGIAPAMRGVPKIKVTFDIDANGILNVSALDEGTGKEQQIRIEASSGLSDDEIKRMREEAEMNAEADKKLREEADVINGADSLCFQTDNNLKDYGDKLSEDKKKDVETAKDALREALDAKKSVDEIKPLVTALNTAWQAASAEMYSKANSNGAQGFNPNDLLNGGFGGFNPQNGPTSGARGTQGGAGVRGHSGSTSPTDNAEDITAEPAE